jgi:hypothetical protein
MKHPIILLLAITAGGIAPSLQAGPLCEAHITKIIRDVRVTQSGKASHAASLQEVIKDNLGVQTGVKSRSELLFQDQTLTRLGPETAFTFAAGTRDLTLDHGSMLLQVPKGLGGAKIRTAAVTAAITGTTIMLEHLPNKHIKVLVLEGSLRLGLNGKLGEQVSIGAGQMVMMRPNAKSLPDPVTVDLKGVMKTSTLVTMGKGKPLPSIGLIEGEIHAQEMAKTNNTLVATNTIVRGDEIVTIGTANAPISGTDARGNVRANAASPAGQSNSPNNDFGYGPASTNANAPDHNNAGGVGVGNNPGNVFNNFPGSGNAFGRFPESGSWPGFGNNGNGRGNPHNDLGPTPAPTPPGHH